MFSPLSPDRGSDTPRSKLGERRTAEGIALENRDDCELRSWVVPGARIEGLLVLISLWRSERSYAGMKKFLGMVGLLAALYPRAYVDHAAELAYVDAEKCTWKPGVYAGTRVVGLLYVLIAIRALRAQ